MRGNNGPNDLCGKGTVHPLTDIQSQIEVGRSSCRTLTFLQSRQRLFNWLQITLAPEDIHDISLFRKHMPVRLYAYPCQTPPPLEVGRISFVPVRSFRIFPMALNRRVSIWLLGQKKGCPKVVRTFGESGERRRSFLGNIVHKGDDGARLCEEVSVSRYYDDLEMPWTRNRTFEPIALP